MANLHSSSPVGQHLGEKHRDDANRRIDARHGERVHRSKTLDENGTILGTKVLARELQEDVDANSDESALEIGCKWSAGSKKCEIAGTLTATEQIHKAALLDSSVDSPLHLFELRVDLFICVGALSEELE